MTGFLPLIRRRWPILLVATLAAAAAGYFTASRVAPTYEASVQLLAGPITSDYDVIRASGQLAQTYAELATSGPVLESTAADVGLAGTPLGGSVRATANDVTRIITVRVRHGDPGLAANIANTVAEKLVQVGAGAPDDPATILQIVNPATAPARPIAPQVPIAVVLAALSGLFAALMLVLLQQRAAGTIQGSDDLAEVSGLPVLGSLRDLGTADDAAALNALSDGRLADAYTLLVAKAVLSRGAKSLLVTGTEDGDRAGGVGMALAAVSAATRSVAVIEAEQPAPLALTSYGHIGAGDGVLGADGGGVVTIPVPRRASVGGAQVEFSAVRAVDGALSRDVAKDRCAEVLARLAADADLVVVVAPPVLLSDATLTWAKLVDVTLVVAATGASREGVAETVHALSTAGGEIAGIALLKRRALTFRFPRRLAGTAVRAEERSAEEAPEPGVRSGVRPDERRPPSGAPVDAP